MLKRFIVIILLLLAALFTPQSQTHAQIDTEGGVYIIQTGDTLGGIAALFDISVQDLIEANQLSDPNSISVGESLIIPGLEGINGILTTKTVQLGETLESLSYKYNMNSEALTSLNRIVSTSEIYAGTQLVVVENEQNIPLQPSFALKSHQSPLELAVLHDTSLWKIQSDNQTNSIWQFIPGDTLYASSESDTPISTISPWIKGIEISPLPLVQGKTTQIKVLTNQPLQLSGNLSENSLHFSVTNENEYVAIQGVYAMAEPGLVSFSISGMSEEDEPISFSQQVLLVSGGYPNAPALVVDPITLDPTITEPEDNLVKQVISPYTESKRWTEPFNYLTDEPCVNAWFGYRRSYNGSPFDYFHTGVDFGVCAQNLNIYAPAPGVIVYTGSLEIRGNATIIDHGLGVYSGIWHQEEIYVNVGDAVETGQKIGMIGNTGRSTGPHLHWEVWVNGVQVDPFDWLETNFP